MRKGGDPSVAYIGHVPPENSNRARKRNIPKRYNSPCHAYNIVVGMEYYVSTFFSCTFYSLSLSLSSSSLLPLTFSFALLK
jgi:hypothetical protein